MDFDLESTLGFLPYGSPYHYDCMKVLRTNKQLVELAGNMEGIRTAAVFAGLSTCPELQSSLYRIEALVHGFLALAGGKKKPTAGEVTDAFASLKETPVRSAEDPAEDVFVSLVYNKHGNFCIFEGLWDSSAFFLQRFLDVVDSMPNKTWFAHLKRRVLALLRLSDALVSRCKVEKYSIGGQLPVDDIPAHLLEDISALSKRVKFTAADLIKLGIEESDLEPFTFDLSELDHLVKESLCTTLLEKCPLVVDGSEHYVMLPSAISVAIRMLVIEGLESKGMLSVLERQLANSYAQHFQSISLLGNLSRVPVSFAKSPRTNLFTSSTITFIDEGRLLNVIFLVDDFAGKDDGWLLGHNLLTDEVADEIARSLKNATDFARERGHFKDGIALIVACGWGRSLSFVMPEADLEDWKIEAVSAPDLTTMSLSQGFTALALWRLLYARDRLAAAGGVLHNISGLLNLYAWSKELKHHLVPHESLAMGNHIGQVFICVNQNSLLDLRQEAYRAWDVHLRVSPEDVPVLVCKFHSTCYFKEDSLIPLYVSRDDLNQQKLRAVYVGTRLELWCSITAPNNSDRSVVYHLFEAAVGWLHKLTPILQETFRNVPQGKLYWHLDFTTVEFPERPPGNVDYCDLKALVYVSYDGAITIHTTFHPGFMQGFACAKNIAERCMLWAFVKGVATACEQPATDGDIERILDSVVPNEDARTFHILTARTFLDYVTEYLSEPIVIDRSDDASLRIGLGQSARSFRQASHIVGISDCTQYLGRVVDHLWEDIKRRLAQVNRRQLVERLILNIEAARAEKKRWNMTIKACIAQHNDRDDVLRSATEKKYSLNGALLGSRIAIEMALCESPLEGALIPGEIEIGQLIASASLMHYLGGWSDAIKFEAMPPEIKVSHFGAVLTKPSFERDILYRFGNEMSKQLFQSEANEYGKLFLDREPSGRVEHLFEPEFNAAWWDEFAFTIDGCRAYIDYLEHLAIRQKTAVMKLRYSDLLEFSDEEYSVSRDTVKAIVESFKLWPRPSWLTVPEGFSDRDFQPWRYRRRLSLVSRPFVQLDDADDPIFLVAPDLIREGVIYVCRCSYEATYDESYFKSLKMKKWIGTKRNAAGHKFNDEVATRLRELGWHAKANRKLTEVLNRKLDNDYGDIDVLAWDAEFRRMLVIECKDLSFAKTHGEIARQLQEFRGRDDRKGKPDRLKRHLKRIEVLRADLDALAKYVGAEKILTVEPRLVFRNLVPVAFSKDDIFNYVQITRYDALESI